MADGLTHVPVELSADWLPQTVTTDPPRYVPHTEWTLVLKLKAAAPIRTAVFLIRTREIAWGLRPGEAAPEVDLFTRFAPHNWANSDKVHVSFAWRRAAVTDPALKNDPRNVVEVTAPARAETGEVFRVAELPEHRITLAALAVVDGDTERRRQDRWRIKPELATDLPEQLVPLASGRQSGVIRS